MIMPNSNYVYRTVWSTMCTFLLQNDALWDMRLVHCGICAPKSVHHPHLFHMSYIGQLVFALIIFVYLSGYWMAWKRCPNIAYWSHIRHSKYRCVRGTFTTTYDFLDKNALKFHFIYEIKICECMSNVFCVEFQNLKFHSKISYPYFERWYFIRSGKSESFYIQ